MKKTWGLLVILLIAAPFLTGCSSKGQETAGQPRMEKRFFDQPERRVDVMGVVKSVVGNEVTILKIEMPEGGQRGGEQGVEPNQEQGDEEKTPTLGGFNGGPGGGPGGMRGGFGGNGSTNQEEIIQMIKERSTGEVTVTVPVGIKMMKNSGQAQGQEPAIEEATLADVAQDKMVSIWLDQNITDRKIAEFVMIR